LTFRTYANTPSGNPGQLWTNRWWKSRLL
jgi:hypothetical protein